MKRQRTLVYTFVLLAVAALVIVGMGLVARASTRSQRTHSSGKWSLTR